MAKKTAPPWKRPRPAAARGKTKLTAQQVAAARERATRAGRRYPNLVDNMWAARLKPQDIASAAFKTDAPITDD